MKVYWTVRAKGLLKQIGQQIASDKPGAARRFTQRIRERARSLSKHPRKGRIVPELEREDLRELIHGNFRIVYRIIEDRIEILAVFRASRLLGEGLGGEEPEGE